MQTLERLDAIVGGASGTCSLHDVVVDLCITFRYRVPLRHWCVDGERLLLRMLRTCLTRLTSYVVVWRTIEPHTISNLQPTSLS